MVDVVKHSDLQILCDQRLLQVGHAPEVRPHPARWGRRTRADERALP